jgi:hypothetical protein
MDRIYGALLAGLIILAMTLPPAGATWFVLKRGKSARAAALFIVPYYSMPILLLLWGVGVKGIRLLGAVVGVVAAITLLCYGWLGYTDYLLRRRKEYGGLTEYEDALRQRNED